MQSKRKVTISIALAMGFVILVLVIRGFQASKEETSASEPLDQSEQSQPIVTTRAARPDREADRRLIAEGVKTDMSLAQFPASEYQRIQTSSTKAAGVAVGDAYIHVPSAGRRVILESNQLGEFPTVDAKINETVGVRMSLDAVKSGTPVRVVIMDGGAFPVADGIAQVVKTEKGGTVAFEFTISPNTGYHRVLVQAQGHPSRILNFNASDGKTWPTHDTVSNE